MHNGGICSMFLAPDNTVVTDNTDCKMCPKRRQKDIFNNFNIIKYPI